ncbi:unnamed protein product [Rotaria sordida]|uniref:Uncharacterized protein n=1 Tax=Rotaria sordida TaxID=392033 RepID=A0A819Q192_9BILA|nr:unnamed protein product [Rotaria sordida]CAF4017567.1 unnamed protein product [Rotaria sordida]
MAEGRALSNNNTVNYLLQDYPISIEYFDKRLTIAKECNDQIGQRRAHGNLGNAYLYLEDFDKALYHYREAMRISELMNDGLLLAQLNFILGRVYNIKQDYETSIYFHEKHLNLAYKFQDYKGQCQAYSILSQLYETINEYDKTKKYRNLYKSLAREIDETNEKTIRSKNNTIKNLRAESICISLSEPHMINSTRSNSVITSNLISSIDEKSIINTNKKLKLNFIQHLTKKSPAALRKQSTKNDPDELIDLVCRMQKSRFDDQRCDIKMTNYEHIDKNTLQEHGSNSQLDDILNTVDRLQQFRLDDQRTNIPNSTNNMNTKSPRLSPLHEQFFDQIAKCQESRMDDQRAILLPLSNINTSSTVRPISAVPIITTPTISETKNFLNESISKTLPDEDFFSLLNRLQSRHNDQQNTPIYHQQEIYYQKKF